MAYGRRATGRDEMLKRNQQRKKKRKAPSNPAPKKEVSQATKTKVAYSGDKLSETPKVKPIGGRKNVLPKIEGKKPKTTTTANRPAPQAPTPPPPVPQEKTSPAPAPADKPKPARQQAATTRDNRNRGMTGYGYTGGRGGSPKPSTSGSKPKRGDYPTGRAGSAAYIKALRAYNKKNSSGSSSSKPKVNRRGRRV